MIFRDFFWDSAVNDVIACHVTAATHQNSRGIPKKLKVSKCLQCLKAARSYLLWNLSSPKRKMEKQPDVGCWKPDAGQDPSHVVSISNHNGSNFQPTNNIVFTRPLPNIFSTFPTTSRGRGIPKIGRIPWTPLFHAFLQFKEEESDLIYLNDRKKIELNSKFKFCSN